MTQLLDSLQDPAMVTDLQGTIELANDKMLQITGLSREQAIGQEFPYPWLTRPDKTNGSALLDQTWQFEATTGVEGSVTDTEGHSRNLTFTITPLRGDDGQPQHLLSVGRDLTPQERAEEAYQAEKRNAVSRLASGVAHDINNNLAVILGYAEYLLGKSQKLDHRERNALDAIQKQAQECADTVRRIELFARPVPRGTFTLLSVNDVIRAVVELTEPLRLIDAGRGGTGIRFETDLSTVPPVEAHLGDLREALTNLIDNAVAAVSEGGLVTLRSRSAAGDVVVEVADNGAGINPLHLRRIFDPFFTTKDPSSSGLGLSIACNLVTQQCGTLSVDSEVGKGTTFTLRFPAAQIDRSAVAMAKEPSVQRRYLEVLVVDDEPLVAGMLQTLLESVGHRATVCLNGLEAVETFKDRGFDLVIVDLAMPEMDGWEVSRRMNQASADVPIIVATGWNMGVEDGKERGANVSAVLKKPFGLEELIGAIETVINPTPAGPPQL